MKLRPASISQFFVKNVSDTILRLLVARLFLFRHDDSLNATAEQSNFCVVMSQRRAILSAEPVYTYLPSVDKAADNTSSLWATTRIGVNGNDQTFSVPSALLDSIVVPLASIAKPVIGLLWANTLP